MKRLVAFLLIAMLVLGAFAGCKSAEDDAMLQVDSDQVFLEDEDPAEDDAKEPAKGDSEEQEQEQEEPSQKEEDSKGDQSSSDSNPKEDPSEEEESDIDPEQEEEELPLETESNGALYSAAENPYKDTLKILAFGNSFSKDAMQYLWDIAKSYGVKNVVLGNLNIGGCSLETHYANMTQNAAVYAYAKNTSGKWETTKNATALDGLQDEDWDIITIQQVSDQSGDPSAFGNLAGILQYLEQRKPKKDTKILWHMTWAYQSDSTKAAFKKYNNDQTKMYEEIVKRVKNDVLFHDNFAGVIPSGTAIQNLRKTAVGDTLTRDGYHLSYGMGRYVAALTWYCYITGADPKEVTYLPSEDQAKVVMYQDEISQAVSNAILNPYESNR